MTLLKYVGPLLTYEQILVIASKISGKEYTDVNDDLTIANALCVVTWAVTKRFPKVELWSTAVPRFSPKNEDQRLLFVCRAYEIPYESPNNYAEVPATTREAKHLRWLKKHGMDWDEMLKQWTTLPDPEADDCD